MIFQCLDVDTILRVIQIITIIILAILAWFIPSKIQKIIYNKNLIKENFKNDTNEIIAIVEKINSQLRERKATFKKTMPLVKDIGNLIDFLFFSELAKQVYFIKKNNKKIKLLIQEIDKRHLSYKKVLTENLPKKNFKVNEKFLNQVNNKKNLFVKQLKLFIYSTFQK